MKAEIWYWSITAIFLTVAALVILRMRRRPSPPKRIWLRPDPMDPGPPPGVVHSNVISFGSEGSE